MAPLNFNSTTWHGARTSCATWCRSGYYDNKGSGGIQKQIQPRYDDQTIQSSHDSKKHMGNGYYNVSYHPKPPSTQKQSTQELGSHRRRPRPCAGTNDLAIHDPQRLNTLSSNLRRCESLGSQQFSATHAEQPS
jgi:hypothetical protein